MVRTFTLPIYHKIMETKKTWEYVSSRAYPIAQALALPLLKDKQRQACPRQRWYIHTTAQDSQGNDNGNEDHYHFIYAKRVSPLLAYTLLYIIKGNWPQGDIKSTHVDALCCITAVSRFKFARFEQTDSNVRKRPFETGRTTGQRSHSIDVVKYPPTHGQAWKYAVIA